MAANFRDKIGKIAIPIFIYHAGIRNEVEYQNADERINNAVDWPTLRRNLLCFGPVIPKLTLLVCVQHA